MEISVAAALQSNRIDSYHTPEQNIAAMTAHAMAQNKGVGRRNV